MHFSSRTNLSYFKDDGMGLVVMTVVGGALFAASKSRDVRWQRAEHTVGLGKHVKVDKTQSNQEPNLTTEASIKIRDVPI